MCLAQEPAAEPGVVHGVDAAAASDKSRPLFKVGDDDASDGRLITAAAEPTEPTESAESAGLVGQEVSKTDMQASQAVCETTADTADVKLSILKCQQLDAAQNVTTPVMHKSASK